MKKRGGRRKGAGRKKLASTLLRELEIKNAHGEACKSLQFLVSVRDDAKAFLSLRVSAAEGIMDRVWGRPRQAMEVSGKDGQPLTIKLVNYANNGPS